MLQITIPEALVVLANRLSALTWWKSALIQEKGVCSNTRCCLLAREAWGCREIPLKHSDRKDEPVHFCMGVELGPQPPMELLPSEGLGRWCSLPLSLCGQMCSCREQEALWVELLIGFDTATWTGVTESWNATLNRISFQPLPTISRDTFPKTRLLKQPHPAWPWTFPRMGHPELLWASSSRVSPLSQ